MNISTQRTERGATLVVGLILLVLITLMVTSAFTLSTGNLKSVGNMQVRSEAISAANTAIERVISDDTIFVTPAQRTISVPPYSVTIGRPVCVTSVAVVSGTSLDTNPGMFAEGTPGVGTVASGYKVTYWDVAATIDDTTTGAKADVHQGIKITLPASPDPCT